MVEVFGAVAREYDSVRPGYPSRIAEMIAGYAGGAPSRIVELGSGTGKGTEVLSLIGAPMTCVEPDRRMAAVLAARFPGAQVVNSTFEAWRPPPGGVPMLACALAWHWLDAGSRNRRAHEALSGGGVLAIFGHFYDLVPGHRAVIDKVFADLGMDGPEREETWFRDDIVASGLWTDVRHEVLSRRIDYTTEQYVTLHRTFSPNLLRPEPVREQVYAAVGQAVDGLGGTIGMDLRTTLVLARKG